MNLGDTMVTPRKQLLLYHFYLILKYINYTITKYIRTESVYFVLRAYCFKSVKFICFTSRALSVSKYSRHFLPAVQNMHLARKKNMGLEMS